MCCCILGFGVSIAGCCVLELFTSTSSPVWVPEQFPDTEIVFNAGDGRMGFVNTDGSALTYITIYVNSEDHYKYSTLPVMKNDNSTLFFLLTPITTVHEPLIVGNYEPYVGEGTGKLVVAVQGEFPVVCENWYSGKPQLLSNGLLVLNPVNKTLALYNPADCVDSENALPLKMYDPPMQQHTENGQTETTPQFGYISPNGQLMAYRRGEIVIRELSSGEETIIGEGNYPAWSHDSQWLSYVGHDGIYIVKTDGTEKRRVVESTYTTSMISQHGKKYYIPPWPAWSPDGQWLVYHLYTDTSVRPPAEIPIYKVNVNTGEVIKIVDYGIFPSWRWPAEQPGE